MTIDVELPRMLADAVGETAVRVEAETLAGVLAALAGHPRLGPLVFDDAGHVRRHVLVFYNDTATRNLPGVTLPLHAGDRISVVQAVSGG